jgi:hypothetical protein
LEIFNFVQKRPLFQVFGNKAICHLWEIGLSTLH